MNDVKAEWNKVELPKTIKVERDRLPTKEEVRIILGGANLAEKVMVLMLISSGIRIGALLGLKLKDINTDLECPMIKINPDLSKNSQGYITFITPESYVIVRDRPQGCRISDTGARARWGISLRNPAWTKKPPSRIRRRRAGNGIRSISTV